MSTGLRPAEALQRLRDGNDRFVAGKLVRATAVSDEERRALVGGQSPVAVILGCSDSRVPPELVFDAGLGELFVVRVAGNVATSAEIGSIEFAVSQLGTRLVVVLGHTGCGAVAATLAALRGAASVESENLGSIVAELRPGIEPLLRGDPGRKEPELILEGVHANVKRVVSLLPERSAVLKSAVTAGRVQIVGAVYDLATGRVAFQGG